MSGRRSIATAALAVLCSTALFADVTITQTMSLEGPATMPAGQMPKVVTRIKGMKARTDVETIGQTVSAIMDATGRQVIVLQSATKSATIVTAPVPPEGAPPKSPGSLSVEFKPTGQSRMFNDMSCEELTVAISFDFSDPSAQLPPEAAAFLKDVRIRASGSVWFAKSAPGAADFVAFQKAAVDANLVSPLAALSPGSTGGMDKLWASLQSIPGVPCMSEMTMAFEGSGPTVDMMKQQGPIKIIQKTDAISADPLPDDIFTIPADYKVEKK